jgi:hypothetical protein
MVPCLNDAQWEAALPKAISDGYCLRNSRFVHTGLVSGCTATTVFLNGWNITCGNVGDSSCYVDSGNQIVRLSADHRLSCNDDEVCVKIHAGAACLVLIRIYCACAGKADMVFASALCLRPPGAAAEGCRKGAAKAMAPGAAETSGPLACLAWRPCDVTEYRRRGCGARDPCHSRGTTRVCLPRKRLSVGGYRSANGAVNVGHLIHRRCLRGAQVFRLRLSPQTGGRIVLASDGLWDGLAGIEQVKHD